MSVGRASSTGREGTYLLVELDEGGLKLFVHVAADVVDVLGLGQGLAGVALLGPEALGGGLGHRVQGNLDVGAVSDLFKLDVTHFLVRDDGGVVGGHVPGQFGEVRSHIGYVTERIC